MGDPVHSPSHYQTDNGLEAIDVIEAFFKENAYLANAFKYLARNGKKDIADPVEDLEKAKEYIDFAINSHRTGSPRAKTLVFDHPSREALTKLIGGAR